MDEGDRFVGIGKMVVATMISEGLLGSPVFFVKSVGCGPSKNWGYES